MLISRSFPGKTTSENTCGSAMIITSALYIIALVDPKTHLPSQRT
jgi:hypothetical protein